MVAASSEAESNDGGLHHTGPYINGPPDFLPSSLIGSSAVFFQKLFTDAPSFCQKAGNASSNDAILSRTKKVTKVKKHIKQ